MILRTIHALLVLIAIGMTGIALGAEPTTQPADVPTTQSAAAPATQSTTAPSASTQPHVPSVRELATAWRERRQRIESMPQVAHFDLSQPITERPQGFALFASEGITLHSLLDRLNQARQDDKLRAVLLTLDGTSMNLAQAMELRDSLVHLTQAGKKTFVYADSYDTASYIVATGASDICLLEGGQIVIPGIGVEMTFAKGLFDKIGVQADYIQIGEYKGADEAFTRTSSSEQARGEINKLLDSLYDQLVEGIATHRRLERAQVRRIIDDALITGAEAKQRGLVDHLVDMDGLRDLLADQLGGEVNLVRDYARPEQPEVDFSNPFALFAMMMRRPEATTRPTIAMVYAEGMIVDGEGGEGLLGVNAVGSREIREAMRIAMRDNNIRAIVLRVDSPGGSALASEAMWQAVRRAADRKPVIVSIGSMAASGGYYLACAGDHIYADATGVVGSIGVVGGKFVVGDLYEKLGITSEPFTRGSNAGIFNSAEPFTESQRQMVTRWMKQTYDLFTRRVMETRAGKIADIDQVARGRIFAAREARQLGMVDDIGGLEDALRHAAERANLQPGEYDVRVLPPPKTLADLLYGSEAATPIKPTVRIGEESALRLLPRHARSTLAMQLQFLQLLEQRPVILATPYVIRVR